MANIDVGKNVFIQKQTRTITLTKGELQGEVLPRVFDYLFVESPKNGMIGNSKPLATVSNILGDITDRGIGASHMNLHEINQIGFNATLILTPQMFQKYADRIGTRSGSENQVTSLRESVEASGQTVSPILNLDHIDFVQIQDEVERNELVDHLIVTAGEYDGEEPLEVIHAGKEAIMQFMNIVLEDKGSRYTEHQAIMKYIKESNHAIEYLREIMSRQELK